MAVTTYWTGAWIWFVIKSSCELFAGLVLRAFIRWKILQNSGWLFLILNKYQTIAVLGLISPTRLFWNSIIQKPLLILQITNFPYKGLSKPWLGKCSPWEKWILQHFKPYFSHRQNSSTPLHWSCRYKVWLTNCFDNLVFQKNHIKIVLKIYSAYLLYLQIYVIFFTMGLGGGVITIWIWILSIRQAVFYFSNDI